jgi:hypothetical protein
MISRDQNIQFKIRNVFHQDPTKDLIDLHGNDVLTGRVIDLSDSGIQKDAFVAVEVEGIEEPLIVPVERILSTA